MIDFATALLSIMATTFLPAFIGLYVSTEVNLSRSRLLAAYGLGIFLWYFSDTIGGSSYLDVNSGFSGGLAQVGLLTVFVLAFLVVFAVHGWGLHIEQMAYASSMVIPALVAAALSIHGFGEGVSFGTFASAGLTPRLADSVSYMLHKALEAVMVGTCYLVYSHDRAGRLRLNDLVALGMILAVPSAIGVALGYYVPFDVAYAFAAATGASVYVAFSLARPLFEARFASSPNPESMKLTLMLLFGFVSIYFAALFHSA